VQTTIDQATRIGCALRVVFDGIRLDLPAPEGMGGFSKRHAFAGAGIKDAHDTGDGASAFRARSNVGSSVGK